MLVIAPGAEASKIGRPYALQSSNFARPQDTLHMPPIEAGIGQDARGGTGAPWRSACALGGVDGEALQSRLVKAPNRAVAEDVTHGLHLARVQLLARAVATGLGRQKSAQRRRFRLLELLENLIHP